MEQERLIGNEFIVDVEVDNDASHFEDENLDTTISYADIYEEIKAVMGGNGSCSDRGANHICPHSLPDGTRSDGCKPL